MTSYKKFEMNTTKTACKAKDPKNCRFHGTGKYTSENLQAAHAKKLQQKKAQAGLAKNTVACEAKAIDLTLAHHSKAQKTTTDFDVLVLANDIVNMPQNEKFGVFLGKTTNEVSTAMEHLYNKMANLLRNAGYTDPTQWNFVRSKNNRVGSDIEETTSNLSFELKFGKPTDLNVGIATVGTLFGKDVMQEFPTQEQRTHWRSLYIAGEINTIDKEHRASLEKVQEKMNAHKGVTSYTASNTLDAFYSGITSLDEISKIHTQNKEAGIYAAHQEGKVVKSTKRQIKRLQLQENLEWEDVTAPEQDFSLWNFDKAILTDESRLSFFFSGNNRPTLKMIYNYKNNYRFGNGVLDVSGKPLVAPAKKGLGSGSFNGWWMDEKNATR